MATEMAALHAAFMALAEQATTLPLHEQAAWWVMVQGLARNRLAQLSGPPRARKVRGQKMARLVDPRTGKPVQGGEFRVGEFRVVITEKGEA